MSDHIREPIEDIDVDYEAAIDLGIDPGDSFYPEWNPLAIQDEDYDADPEALCCPHGHIYSDECLACIASSGVV